ncbi:DNA topoisomerase IB [Specibacter sp. RAF43]|uniref:DNA topoisomerase IB n=1 Tax=Specibacter sp. RAF43 TaxID=3233057 RepID=UPI003F9A60AC
MARLHRSDVEEPGIRRGRAGTGFTYSGPDGHRLGEDERGRIADLVIPPAWREVWINPDPRGHIQAVGRDDAGRRQYIYHPSWTDAQDREKFRRAARLGALMPVIRRRTARQFRESARPRTRALAAALRLLDAGALRIGSENYARTNHSYGLSTLQCRHVRLKQDSIALAFPGKSGRRWERSIEDSALARFLEPLLARPSRAPLLAYRDGADWVELDAAAINAHIRALAGDGFTAKDFRTWQGTMTAAGVLVRAKPDDGETAIRNAVRAVARQLGNTEAVARRAYIDPRLLSAFAEGALEGRKASDAVIAEILQSSRFPVTSQRKEPDHGQRPR